MPSEHPSRASASGRRRRRAPSFNRLPGAILGLSPVGLPCLLANCNMISNSELWTPEAPRPLAEAARERQAGQFDCNALRGLVEIEPKFHTGFARVSLGPKSGVEDSAQSGNNCPDSPVVFVHVFGSSGVCSYAISELCKDLYHHNGVWHESPRSSSALPASATGATAPPLGVSLPHQRCGDGEVSGSGV